MFKQMLLWVKRHFFLIFKNTNKCVIVKIDSLLIDLVGKNEHLLKIVLSFQRKEVL